MPKLKPLIFSFLVFNLSLISFLLFSYPICVFAASEDITITTYYPSPSGSYNELSANKLAIGYTDASDQPTREGDIRLKAQTGNPLGWANGRKGQVAYSSQNNSLYLFDGSNWVAVGSNSMSYTHYCYLDILVGVGSPICLNRGTILNPNFCPIGYTQKTELGTWGMCHGVTSLVGTHGFYRDWPFPPGGGCALATKVVEGRAFVCSKD